MKEKIKNFFSSWIGSILIFPLILYLLINIGKFHFIDFVNLLIHEGGHGIFKVFGGYIYTLGGTLMQLFIPSMFVIYYLTQKKKFLSQIFLVWLGENLINISIYVKDARIKQLPLLGGNKVYHDWNYLLSESNLLEYDQLIGNILISFSILVFLFALLIPLFIKKEKPVNLNLQL
ncbi:MAG: hypothetical protein N2321_02215 [Melioribacteraceae bacterium]|nr:hypothetical protein [Melioribacteraceae bacterium]